MEIEDWGEGGRSRGSDIIIIQREIGRETRSGIIVRKEGSLTRNVNKNKMYKMCAIETLKRRNGR